MTLEALDHVFICHESNPICQCALLCIVIRRAYVICLLKTVRIYTGCE